MKPARGFTLIELLVVMAIMAILASIGTLIYTGTKIRSDDAKKEADVHAIAKAYEANFDPLTGSYRPLSCQDFAGGNCPINDSNYAGLLGGSSTGFKVCTTLSNQTEFCLESTQGNYVAQAAPSPSSSAGATPTPSSTSMPTPTPTSTPLPTPTTLVSDSFNRANSDSLGNADTGQAWVLSKPSGGRFGIIGNLAYPYDGCPASGFAVVDGGASDATMQVTLSVNPQDTKVVWRYVDSNNYYQMENKDGSSYYEIDKVIGGARSIIGTANPAANGDILKIVSEGSSVKVYINNNLAAQINDTSLSGTKYGIGTWCNGNIRFDDFSVTTNTPATPIPSPSGTPANNTSYDMKVLVLKYFPLTSDGQNIDINVTGDVGDLYSVIRQRTIDVTEALRIYLEKSTSYLGYSNPSAPSALRYQIVNTYEYTQAVPFDPTTRRPLYDQILTAHNICDYVNNQGINEVWMWAYQGPTYPGSSYPYLNISESKMSGPYGDISNSYRGNDMPYCGRTYRLYVFNYNAGTGAAMHSWGHQMEAEMSAVDSNLWSIFQGPHNGRNSALTTRCGDVHSPPNAASDYDYRNSSSWNSDCLDWNPDGLGNTTSISCTTWSCTDGDIINNTADIKYFVWMWQNMPGMNNNKSYQGLWLRNWWDVHGDFDNVMGNSRRLTVQ